MYYLPTGSKDMNLSTKQNLIESDSFLLSLLPLYSFPFLLRNALTCSVKMDLIDFFLIYFVSYSIMNSNTQWHLQDFDRIKLGHTILDGPVNKEFYFHHSFNQ